MSKILPANQSPHLSAGFSSLITSKGSAGLRQICQFSQVWLSFFSPAPFQTSHASAALIPFLPPPSVTPFIILRVLILDQPLLWFILLFLLSLLIQTHLSGVLW